MAAPEGNQFWKLREVHGRPCTYESADALWVDCEEYFSLRSKLEWNRQPLPFTQASLCLFLGITQETWTQWRKPDHDFSEVVARVDDIIRDQKMTGAIVGAYNHNIIARDLGLADKKEHSGDVTISRVVREVVDPKHSDS